MPDIIERFDYDIDPALRKLRTLQRATDQLGDVTQTVFVEIEGLDDIADIESALDSIPDQVMVEVQIDDSEIDSAESNLLSSFDDPFVTVQIDDSEIVRVGNDLNGLESETYNIDLEVDDPTVDLEDDFNAFVSGGFLLGIGAAAGALIATGLAEGLDIDKANDRLAAQLNLTNEQAEVAGRISGELFADAYGESATEVNDVLRGIVAEGLADFEEGNEEALTNIAGQTFSLAETFDQDLNEVLRATSAIVKNDLAPDADAALDIITRGLQLAGPRAEDLLETFGEYSNQFADAGLNAEGALSLIAAALDGGARSTDGAADALKELFLRITEGEGPSQDALESIGLSVEDLREGIAEGGPAATAAYQEVFRAIAALEDPTEQARLAQELLGGAYEQVGLAGVIAMGEATGSIEDLETAAEDVDATLNDNLLTTLTSFRRTITTRVSTFLFDGLQRAIEFLTPAFQELQGAIRAFVISFQIADGDITSSGLAGFFERLGFIAAVAFGILTDRIALFVELVRTVAGAIADALPDEDPFALIAEGAAIAGEVFTRVQDVITSILEALVPFVERVVTRIVEFFQALDLAPILDALGAAFETVFEVIEDIDFEKIFENLADIFDFLLDVLEPVVQFLIDILGPAFEDVGKVLGEVIGFIANLLEGDWRAAWNSAVGIVTSVVGLILGILGRLLSSIRSLLSPIGSFIAGIWNGIASTAQAAWTGITSTVSGAVDGLVGGIEAGFSGVEGFLSGIWNGIAGTAQSAWTGITSTVSGAVGGLVGGIEAGFSGISDTISSVWNTIGSVAQTAWTAITTTIGNAIGVIGDTIEGGVSRWLEIHTAIFEAIIGVIVGSWETITGAVSTALDTIEGVITSVWNGIIGTITTVGQTLVSTLQGVWDTITGAVTTAWEGVSSTITGAISGAIDGILGLGADFLAAGLSLGSSLIDGITDGLAGAVGGIASIGTAFYNAAANAFNSVISTINSALEFTIPVPGLPDININPPDIPSIPLLAEGAYFPATRGGQLAILAENRFGEVAMNEGASFARNMGLISQFQGGAFLSRLAGELQGGGSKIVHVHDHRSTVLEMKTAPPTNSPKVWGDELLARMKLWTKDQDQARGL